jgi:ribulose-bisphosphate carboxylase large chain
MNIFNPEFNSPNYFVVTYWLESKTTLRDAAWELAIGQSVGNPNVRSKWETEELFVNHSVIILEEEELLYKTQAGVVKFAFPLANIDLSIDGISQLLCQVMGGQLDIDNITACHLNKIEFPSWVENKYFHTPYMGLSGMRKFTGVYNKPLLGGIIKPKVIDRVSTLVDMVHEMIDGGVNFIKEDEIMANPSSCDLYTRLKHIVPIVEKSNVMYTYCINSDDIVNAARFVHDCGGKGVHVNFWSGFGAYKTIRDNNLPLFVHFQKSGDKILTNPMHAYHIKWDVICYLASLCGIDSIHAGMWGGYMNEDEYSLNNTLGILQQRNVIPALSCGMHPGLIDAINNKFGVDYMANVGGALHGHPDGTKAGAQAMRQSIDKQYGIEYEKAIRKWGKL